MRQIKFVFVFCAFCIMFGACSNNMVNQPQLGRQSRIVSSGEEQCGYYHNIMLDEYALALEDVMDTISYQGLRELLLNMTISFVSGNYDEDFVDCQFVIDMNGISDFEDMADYIELMQENLFDGHFDSPILCTVYSLIDNKLNEIVEDTVVDEMTMMLKIDSLRNQLEDIALSSNCLEEGMVIAVASVMQSSFQYWSDEANMDKWTLSRNSILNDRVDEDKEKDEDSDEESRKEEQKKFKEKVIKYVKADVAGACVGSLLGPGSAIGVGAITSGMAILASKDGSGD